MRGLWAWTLVSVSTVRMKYHPVMVYRTFTVMIADGNTTIAEVGIIEDSHKENGYSLSIVHDDKPTDLLYIR